MTAALSTAAGDEVFTGTEAEILRALDDRLRTLTPGVLATWNGAAFDLPFLADRAAACGVALGLRLTPDPTVISSHDPLPGHAGAYRGPLVRPRPPRRATACTGRTWARCCACRARSRRSPALVGLVPVEVDRERIHDLPPADLAAYVASDARLARVLVERRWPGIARAVDQPGQPVTPPH